MSKMFSLSTYIGITFDYLNFFFFFFCDEHLCYLELSRWDRMSLIVMIFPVNSFLMISKSFDQSDFVCLVHWCCVIYLLLCI